MKEALINIDGVIESNKTEAVKDNQALQSRIAASDDSAGARITELQGAAHELEHQCGHFATRDEVHSLTLRLDGFVTMKDIDSFRNKLADLEEKTLPPMKEFRALIA